MYNIYNLVMKIENKIKHLYLIYKLIKYIGYFNMVTIFLSFTILLFQNIQF